MPFRSLIVLIKYLDQKLLSKKIPQHKINKLVIRNILQAYIYFHQKQTLESLAGTTLQQAIIEYEKNVAYQISNPNGRAYTIRKLINPQTKYGLSEGWILRTMRTSTDEIPSKNYYITLFLGDDAGIGGNGWRYYYFVNGKQEINYLKTGDMCHLMSDQKAIHRMQNFYQWQQLSTIQHLQLDIR